MRHKQLTSDQVGAQTGRRYEYQYERTARAALGLLADGPKHVCVYCEWHDDYVIEIGDPPTRYEFHQVKGRKPSQGPWTFREFFGVSQTKAKKTPKKAAVVNTDAVMPFMLMHHHNFAHSCAGLAFVTNAGLDSSLSSFLKEIGGAAIEADLPSEAQIAFKHIARAYTATDPKLAPSAADLFTWLRGLKVHTEQGQLENVGAALLELADVVVEFSEIELLQRQAKQIAREIVSRVRAKVAHTTTVVPTSDEYLQRDKGIVIAELLKDLSLSAPAYEQLKAGAQRDVVKTLSRLQRYCSKNDMGNHLIAICTFKAGWDIWRTVERHFLKSTDYVLLEQKAHDLLKEGLKIQQMIAEAKDISKQFSGITVTPLTPEHVMGLLFSLAAQSEAVNNA